MFVHIFALLPSLSAVPMHTPAPVFLGKILLPCNKKARQINNTLKNKVEGGKTLVTNRVTKVVRTFLLFVTPLRPLIFVTVDILRFSYSRRV